MLLLKRKNPNVFFLLLLFPPYVILVCPLFFLSKCPCDFQILKFERSFFFVKRWKKWVFHQFGFYNPKTSKNKAFSLIFFRIIESEHPLNTHFKGKNSSDYIIKLYQIMNNINMDSHFKDNINLPNSYLSVLGHC